MCGVEAEGSLALTDLKEDTQCPFLASMCSCRHIPLHIEVHIYREYTGTYKEITHPGTQDVPASYFAYTSKHVVEY